MPTRRAETALLLKIALPLIAAYLAELAMLITTKVVVGRLGYHELAAVGLAGGLSFEVLIVLMGLLSIVGIGLAIWATVGFGSIGEVAGRNITGLALFICGIVGLIVTALIVVITEYYTGTGKRPVVSIAQASVSGPGPKARTSVL